MKNIVKSSKVTSNTPSKDILQNHLNSFLDNNLETLMSDYTNESVLISPETTCTGLEEIREYFLDLISHFPKHKSFVEIDKTVINDELVYIVWHAKTPSVEVPFATDTFIMKNGKILRQTFAG